MMNFGELFSLIIYGAVIILFISSNKKAKQRRREMLDKRKQDNGSSAMQTRMHELFPEEKIRQTKDRLKKKYEDAAGRNADTFGRPKPVSSQKTGSYTAGSAESSTASKNEDTSYIRKTPRYIPPRHAGKRHEVWDEVPNGYCIKCCGYCGAENAVPLGAMEAYSCYFCREEL